MACWPQYTPLMADWMQKFAVTTPVMMEHEDLGYPRHSEDGDPVRAGTPSGELESSRYAVQWRLGVNGREYYTLTPSTTCHLPTTRHPTLHPATHHPPSTHNPAHLSQPIHPPSFSRPGSYVWSPDRAYVSYVAPSTPPSFVMRVRHPNAVSRPVPTYLLTYLLAYRLPAARCLECRAVPFHLFIRAVAPRRAES